MCTRGSIDGLAHGNIKPASGKGMPQYVEARLASMS